MSCDECSRIRSELQAALDWIRQRIWSNHGCRGPELYGDDGELQCRHGDMRRMPLEQVFEIDSRHTLENYAAFMELREQLQAANDQVLEWRNACLVKNDEIRKVSEIIGEEPKTYLQLRAELQAARQRLFINRRSPSSDHTTACSIWGDDGLGHTAENFKEPLPCNCGALENYANSELQAARRIHEEDIEMQEKMRADLYRQLQAAQRRIHDQNMETIKLDDMLQTTQSELQAAQAEIAALKEKK